MKDFKKLQQPSCYVDAEGGCVHSQTDWWQFAVIVGQSVLMSATFLWRISLTYGS